MKKISNIVKNNIFFYSLVFLILLWHISTLAYNPLPWFDETFFASIAKSLAEGRGFFLDICPIQTGGREVLSYGPVYFSLTALSFNLFGITAFSFRIVAFLFTALTIVAADLILKKINISLLLRRVIIILLMFDNIIRISSHSGRMDMVALFFVLMAYYFFLSKEYKFQYSLLALFGTIALLTTPRTAVFLIPLWSVALFQAATIRKWDVILTLILVPSILYSTWIFFEFGSFEDFLSYYLNNEYKLANGQKINTFHFIGGNFIIHYFQWPIILSSLGLFLYFLKQNHRSTFIKALLFLFPIFVYYLLVYDTGRYSAMVMPFWYILLAWELQNLSSTRFRPTGFKVLKMGIPAIILIINAALFTGKSIQFLGALPHHNPAPMKKWITKHLPRHSRVVGDDRFFYACVQQQSELQYIYRPHTASERASYHATNFNPDYLLLCKETKEKTIQAYRKHFRFKETYHFSPPKKDKRIDQFLKKLPSYKDDNYEAWLIKVELKKNARSVEMSDSLTNQKDSSQATNYPET